MRKLSYNERVSEMLNVADPVFKDTVKTMKSEDSDGEFHNLLLKFHEQVLNDVTNLVNRAEEFRKQ